MFWGAIVDNGAMALSTTPAESVDGSSAATWARSTAATASLGAAVVHAASIPVHFDHGTRYGVAFIVMAVLGTAATITPLLERWRRGLAFTLVVNVGILVLWLVATNWGVPGDSKEAIGMASAVATMLELAAVTAAAVGLAFGANVEHVSAPIAAGRGSWRARLVAIMAVALLATPGVATAADHHHGTTTATTSSTSHDHANQESGVSGDIKANSITGIFSTAPPAAHAGGSGNAVHDDSVTAACAPSDGQVAAADALVAASTLALQKYRDPNAAVADGYRPLGFEPNGVNHYINQAYLSDGRMVDPEHPESILYGRKRDGSMYPIGVMYMTSSATERGPRIGGCLTPWHRHGFPFAKPGETSVEMMHVWTIGVPGGPYAEHVEGEYARIYLGVTPIDTDISDPTVTTTTSGGGATPTITTPFERLVGLFGTGSGSGTGLGVSVLLNALNVYRTTLCAEPLHTQLASRVKDTALVDRICDPILNGPLPGASAPDMSVLLKQFAANKTGS